MGPHRAPAGPTGQDGLEGWVIPTRGVPSRGDDPALEYILTQPSSTSRCPQRPEADIWEVWGAEPGESGGPEPTPSWGHLVKFSKYRCSRWPSSCKGAKETIGEVCVPLGSWGGDQICVIPGSIGLLGLIPSRVAMLRASSFGTCFVFV